MYLFLGLAEIEKQLVIEEARRRQNDKLPNVQGDAKALVTAKGHDGRNGGTNGNGNNGNRGTGRDGRPQQRRGNGQRKRAGRFQGNCFSCGKTGHRAVDCRFKVSEEAVVGLIVTIEKERRERRSGRTWLQPAIDCERLWFLDSDASSYMIMNRLTFERFM
jgi:hypothetical protein